MQKAIIDKFLKRNTSPYIKEMLYVIFIDVFIVALICAVFLVGTLDSGQSVVQPLIIIVSVYIFVELVFNYSLGLLSLIDRSKGDYIEKKGMIVDYAVESSWSGWLMTSIITKMYPKELAVNRYRMQYKDIDGNIDFVRVVMSREKGSKVYQNILKKNNFNIHIMYCKRSKILLCFELGDVQNEKNKKGLTYHINDINNSF